MDKVLKINNYIKKDRGRVDRGRAKRLLPRSTRLPHTSFSLPKYGLTYFLCILLIDKSKGPFLT